MIEAMARWLVGVIPDGAGGALPVLVAVTSTNDIRVAGARGTSRPDSLKVSVGYRAGSKVEAEISYVGPNAARRGALAAEIVTARLAGVPIRAEVLGGSVDCRLRVAAISHDRTVLDRVGDEVESLYTNGPAGGGGVVGT